MRHFGLITGSARNRRQVARACADCLEPRTLFAGSVGSIFVTNDGNGNIGEYTHSGGVVNASLVSGLGDANGITRSGSDLYVVNGADGDIFQCSTSGAVLNTFGLSGIATGGGIVAAGSNLFVTEDTPDQGGAIGEFTTTGATVNATLISGLGEPLGIAISGNDLFVADNSRNRISEYTTSGKTVNASLISVPDPLAVAVSGSALFVVNGGRSVMEYTTSGKLVKRAFVTAVSDPEALAVSGSEVFVGNDHFSIDGNDGTIGEFTTSGATINASLITGLSDPQGIYIDTVTASAAPLELKVVRQPTRVTASAKFSPVVIDLEHSDGSLATSSRVTVRLSIVGGTSGGKLAGTTTAVSKNGTAVFSNLAIQKPGTYKLEATAANFASGQSTPIVVGPAATRKMIFSKQAPTSVVRSHPFAVEVELFDAFGNLATDNNSTVFLSLGTHPKGSVLSGIMKASVADGVADFGDLMLNPAGQ
jgi:hypothetical protein